ncbi:redoxin domain-containing protein [Rhodohalobacter sp.]|uniref:redoxin domain-containing protein n=1 Tax=Rhodohalobacter sp. TaxID=1974210 RepID=UPI002ACEA00A|nr:redoxin domain-containing protein [Rhodohalobacter sp.]MDZ7757360.1 redoxin domain-containing protein [Rhodohalobacter sp.]
MAISKGDIVQNFSLQNTNGEQESLRDLTKNGKAVLLFFPLAFSSTCTEELCVTRDNMKLYNSLKANVVGISVDSFFVLKEFKKANNLNFTLLSDFNREVSEQFDIIYDDFYGLKGVPKRAAFVIDENLKVEYAEVLEDASNLPDFRAIQKVLSKSDEVAETK